MAKAFTDTRAASVLAFEALAAPLVIFGFWAFNSSALVSFFGGSPAMVPWTAVCLILLSGSVLFPSSARAGSLVVAVASAVFLFEYFAKLHLGFDLWFFSASVQFDSSLRFPGRPSPQTSVALLSLATAHLLRSQALFEANLRSRIAYQSLSFVAISVSLLAMLGYFYDATHLFTFTKLVGVSFLTAVSLFLIGLSTLALDAKFGIVRAYRQKNAAGLFLRRFAIAGVFAPFLVAALIGACVQRDLISSGDGMAFFIFFTIASIITLAIYVTRSLEQIGEQTISLESQRIEIASANEAARLKDKFVTNMSHELRTPMMAIMGYLDLLREPTIEDQERTQLATKAERSARGLLGVLDDVLDIAKVEADRVQIIRSAFTIRSLIEDVTSVLMLEAERKKLAIRVEIADGVPEKMISDSQRVRQILLNLLGNSVKFTENGFATVRVSLGSVPSTDTKLIVFEVIDSGIGILAEKQRHLFQAFFQGDDSITRKFGGTGLGLAISKNFAELLGGTLSLSQSTSGAGSTFRLELPYSVPEVSTARQAAAKASAVDLTGVRVLLVEDNIDNQFLITRYLKSAGAEVDLAQNGQEAVDKASAATYAVILMDLQMPIMGGLEATRILRDKGYRLPIVALSAHVREEHRDRSLEAGCSAHVGKPISKPELLEIVQKYAAA